MNKERTYMSVYNRVLINDLIDKDRLSIDEKKSIIAEFDLQRTMIEYLQKNISRQAAVNNKLRLELRKKEKKILSLLPKAKLYDDFIVNFQKKKLYQANNPKEEIKTDNLNDKKKNESKKVKQLM